MNVEKLMEDGHMSSPASTPDTSFAEEKFLVRHFKEKTARKHQWYDVRNIPFAIVTVSIFQVIFHIYSTPILNKVLRFEPNKRLELWRFVTYMLVHDDWSHLALNVVIQCIFASFLENKQGKLRVLVIYILGGITGVLGAACIHPDFVIGSSAGGYSLLLSNVANIILNYETIEYKVYRSLSIATLVLFDIVYDVVHVCSKKEPQVSWQAHFVGGLTGLFLGVVIFNCHSTKSSRTRKILFSLGLFLYSVLVISFIAVTVQIKKCTPSDVIPYKIPNVSAATAVSVFNGMLMETYYRGYNFGTTQALYIVCEWNLSFNEGRGSTQTQQSAVKKKFQKKIGYPWNLF